MVSVSDDHGQPIDPFAQIHIPQAITTLRIPAASSSMKHLLQQPAKQGL